MWFDVAIATTIWACEVNVSDIRTNSQIGMQLYHRALLSYILTLTSMQY
jgi:hypothetical protein